MAIQIETRFINMNIYTTFSFDEEIIQNVFNNSEKLRVNFNETENYIEIAGDKNNFNLFSKEQLFPLIGLYFINVPNKLINLNPSDIYVLQNINYTINNNSVMIDTKQFESLTRQYTTECKDDKDLSENNTVGQPLSLQDDLEKQFTDKNQVKNRFINLSKEFMKENGLSELSASGPGVNIEIKYTG